VTTTTVKAQAILPTRVFLQYQSFSNAGHYTFIHSFIPAIYIAPLQVLYYSAALPTTARILYRSLCFVLTRGWQAG